MQTQDAYISEKNMHFYRILNFATKLFVNSSS